MKFYFLLFLLSVFLKDIISAISTVSTTTINLLDFNYVEYIGRFDFQTSPNGNPRCDWPGSTIRIYISIPSDGSNNDYDDTTEIILTTTINNYQNGTYYIEAQIDRDNYNYYEISPTSKNVITLTLSLLEGNHSISLIKRTEANYSTALGITEYESMTLTNGILLPVPSSSSDLKFLFIGDSVTAGYGVDGIYPCHFSPETENILDSFATLSSNALNAQSHILAWSAKGAVRNYNDSSQVSVNPMPVYYNRTLATDPSTYWDPKTTNFIPDLVFVMLGTNDYSTEPVPTDEEFIGALSTLLIQIQTDYPSTIVVAVCSPLYQSHQEKNIEYTASLVGVDYLFIDFAVYDGGKGCDNHPSQQTQVNMADIVIPYLQSLLYDKTWEGPRVQRK